MRRDARSEVSRSAPEIAPFADDRVRGAGSGMNDTPGTEGTQRVEEQTNERPVTGGSHPRGRRAQRRSPAPYDGARREALSELPKIQEAALAQVWKHGGRVIACDQSEVAHDDPDDPMRTAMRQMMGVFAQLERGMIVARLRRGRQVKKASGGYAQGRPPYGYRAEAGALVPVDEEQAAIIRARQLSKRGKSLRQIAEILGQEGHHPRTGHTWHPPMVARLLDTSRLPKQAAHAG